MYCYEMPMPIDHVGLMVNFKELYQKTLLPENKHYDYVASSDYLRRFLERCLRELAKSESYWEGDIRDDELYIGSVPDEDNGNDFYIVLKQDNNGGSYIVSSFLLHQHERYICPRGDRPVTQGIQDGIKKILDHFAPVENKGFWDAVI